jgi:MinD superfamily P-loop ATPase
LPQSRLFSLLDTSEMVSNDEIYLIKTPMKQLVILSGKGGTGKTSIAAAFAHLAFVGKTPLRTVLVDADVDASNLELVLQPEKLEEHDFSGGTVAMIDEASCQGCGLCQQVCRFEAVLPPAPETELHYRVDSIACDGCAACVYQCPEGAIHMENQLAGRWFRSQSRFGPFLHAALYPAQENSGKLVTMVKQQARLLGQDTHASLVIVDGPPGIGCPVISAASGADLALIVVEPTLAGIHDMDRIVRLAQHFRLPAVVCINKADIYPEGANRIMQYCSEHALEIAGQIPFDETVMHAMVHGDPVTAYLPETPASLAIQLVWDCITAKIIPSSPPAGEPSSPSS